MVFGMGRIWGSERIGMELLPGARPLGFRSPGHKAWDIPAIITGN